MSHLLVITFDDPEEAAQVRKTLSSEENRGLLSLEDSAVVAVDPKGKVHVKNEVDRGVAIGAIGGGALGLLIGGLFFPLAGLLIGAVGGALVGKSLDLGIDKQFVKDVTSDMQPGTSAIFLVIREADADAALAALKPYKGTVRYTSYPPEVEEEVRNILSKKM
jgi:uncharacterized membrane protein